MATEIPGQTHTNKYYLPDPLDNGVVYAEVIEDFMTRMAKHNHDGSDSSEIGLNIQKIVKEYVNIDVGGKTSDQEYVTWTDIGGGMFKAILPLDSTSYDANVRLFFVYKNSKWVSAHLKTEPINGSTYYVYSNQPLLSLRVVSI